MERLFKQILPTIIAVAAAVITLAGYLVPAPGLALLMTRWAAIVAAFALVLGIINVLRVHLARFFRARRGWPLSVTLLLSAVLSFAITAAGLLPGLLTENISLLSDWLELIRLSNNLWFNYVILPLEASAAGLVALALALAAFRLTRRAQRRNMETLVFLVSALAVLFFATPLPSPIGEVLAAFREWIISVPALAGMRGFLIGVGLGTLVIGVRVITGRDRPHSDV
jgi:hypothetical protein